MKLVLFDLDNTLIAGDSDHAWGEYLVESGMTDGESYRQGNDYFYAQYVAGTLDIEAYIRFSVSPLLEKPLDHYFSARDAFIEEKIKPLMLPKATQLIEKHRSAGDKIAIVTATNAFVTRPIANLLGIQTLIATELVMDQQGKLTGSISGTPCFQAGKIERVKAWLGKQDETALESAYFYSDSKNDIPLLSYVGHPVAVDPDAELHQYALDNHWEIISLR